MELYNEEFVYFDWDDNLEGKKGFIADNINNLKQHVKDNDTSWFGVICKYSRSDDEDVEYPFETIDNSGWHRNFRFAYYDPYYEFRKAYLEGKQLQFKKVNGKWEDVVGDPVFKGAEYRIKPKMWYIVLDDFGLSRTNLKGDDDVMFEGTEEECIQWMEKYKKFEKIMLAWKEGKTIQYKENDEWVDWMLNGFPRDGAFIAWKEWRIKEELEKEVEDKGVEYANNETPPKGEWIDAGYSYGQIVKAYEKGALDFAEPREKQIEIDAEQIRALQKQNGELTDRVRELEAQIECMKRYLDCEYCEHYTQRSGCKNCNEEIRSDWKLKEIKEK